MIYGDGLRLRAVERSDLPRFVQWLNDPEVTAGLMQNLPLSLLSEEQWFETMIKRPQEEQTLVIEIQDGQEWKPVGDCGFHEIDWKSRSASVGIFIGEKSYWSQGYGTQVMRLLLRIGFEKLNLNRVALEVFENNPRAIRAYEKAGFVHEGRRRQGIYKNGQYLDILLMSVIRSEWQE